jgi:putative Holliday junction resolvase
MGRPEGTHEGAKREAIHSADPTPSIDATLLAFDFGTRRIGIALGTARLGSARPLTTIESERNDARFAAIDALVAEWKPDRLVVGLPVHADGTAHDMTARARRFARQLAARYGLPVAEVDERYTSEVAAAQLRTEGRGGRDRRSMRDAVSAQIILQAYLDTPNDDRPA